MKNEMIERVKEYLLTLQNSICHILEKEDGGASFAEDTWKRPSGGGGITRIMSNGALIEKGGVNFSHVFGETLPPSATLERPELTGAHFQAVGVSLVIHPDNPYVPTTHANFRFFCAEKEGLDPVWWFGGGYDLTPYYGFDEDCIHWHQTAKDACDKTNKTHYPRFKQWCDDYFYLKHRDEARGIGGLFFDDINQGSFDECFSFIKHIGDSFIPAYLPIVQRRKALPFGEREKNFQHYRHGRYVEFNLIYDRGTIFGLQSGGRTESILMSLPSVVNWTYNWQPELGSPEEKLYTHYLKAKDWII